MTRDEFIYQNLKDNVALYRTLFLVYAVITIAAAVMAVLAVVLLREYGGALTAVGMALGFALAAMGSRETGKSYADAVAEIGDDPTGLDTCRTYSQKTAGLIAGVRMLSKGQFGAIFAYGIIALSMFAGGAVILAVAGGEIVFIALGILLEVGGLLLLFLSIKSYRNWRAAKQLNMLD